MDQDPEDDSFSRSEERHHIYGADNEDNRIRCEVLVMSEAGKPIYSYPRREDVATLMPLCSALINYAIKTQKENLVTMKTSENLSIQFAMRSPLFIIVIHDSDSNVEPIILIDQIEAQIISILTAKTLRSVFEERPTYDLKRLLYGSEKFIDSLVRTDRPPTTSDWPQVRFFLAVTSTTVHNSNLSNTSYLQASSHSMPNTPHRMLIPTVIMPSSMRDNLHNIMSNAVTNNSKNIVFSLLFKIIYIDRDDGLGNGHDGDHSDEDHLSSDDEGSKTSTKITFQLVTVCNHINKYKLKLADIHIIHALLNGTKAQLSTVESLWMPVCLPRFNEDAFLHAYIAFTNQKRNCLVIFSVDRDEFSNCQQTKKEVEDKLDVILKDPNQRVKMFSKMSPLVHPVLLELQEKLTNCSLSGDQLAEVKQQAQIYNSKLELYHARQLQFLWYQTNRQVICWQRSAKNDMSRILHYITRKMLQSSLKALWLKLSDESTFLGWHVPTFQLYAQFDHTVTSNEATEVVQRITTWIKKEEDNFSVIDYKG